MPITEAHIEIASKLYASRRTLRRLLGPQYARCAPRWIDLVRQYCAMRDLDTLPGLMEMLKIAPADETTSLWLTAAAVELMEPDDQTPE